MRASETLRAMDREENRIQMLCSEYSTAVTNVLMVLWNRHHEAVEFLFGDSADEYKREWLSRTPELFWAQLDLGNRRRLVKFACDTYCPEMLLKGEDDG